MNYFLRRTIVVFLTCLVLAACSSDKKRNVDFLPPISIQIPYEIKGEPELVKVINSSEKAINELSDNLEQLIVDSKEVLDKKEGEEISLMENLKVGQLMVEFVSNSTELGKLIDDFDNYKKEQEAQGLLDDTQVKALEKVGASFAKSKPQFNKKYENYYN